MSLEKGLVIVKSLILGNGRRKFKMESYEVISYVKKKQIGKITISPTAITDKEEVHELYGEDSEWDLILSSADYGVNLSATDEPVIIEHGDIQTCVTKIRNGITPRVLYRHIVTYDGVIVDITEIVASRVIAANSHFGMAGVFAEDNNTYRFYCEYSYSKGQFTRTSTTTV